MRSAPLELLAIACLLASAANPQPPPPTPPPSPQQSPLDVVDVAAVTAEDDDPAVASFYFSSNFSSLSPTLATQPGGGDPLLCRANNGSRWAPRLYGIMSCMSCFRFMYSRAASVMRRARGLRFVNAGQFADNACEAFAALEPKVAPPAAECRAMLLRCCHAAEACCRSQLAGENLRRTALAGEFCPATWDGLYCIDATASGAVAEFHCPEYLPSANVNNTFTIACTRDGTWETKTSGGVVWESTNYVPCLNNSLVEVSSGVLAHLSY